MTFEKENYKEIQRNKVLAGALECFSSKGYVAATINDIVDHSGISKGSIYKLFKSKEEIYVQLMYQNTDEVLHDIQTILAKYTTYLDKISSLFTEYLSKDLNSNLLNSFLVQSEFELFSSRREDIMKLLEERRALKINMIADVMLEGIENGEFKKEIDAELYSELFWSFVDGAVTHKLLFPNYPYDEIIKGQREIFIKKLIRS
ncbi:TetR/AcrR family transcriptional regulator [Bacillus sp. S/N-304-OC-R1]|uniref:TetR/AcrR family transcriptional regulator n=1 Tax=Bacillus sp. S/N-304-OC-R1 TaxID=2758034 RepID=UPI001C8E32FE|nr:TetR/AcrR family transcriptional regulator [Bacillus sp. S/N-304-OC-R1]MBY0122804.1 TetR/AcrR family transcriptional regulator [Bacillus sp. S/N-304-OC-R1]